MIASAPYLPVMSVQRSLISASGIVNLTRSSRPSWPLSLERGQPYSRAKDFSAPERRATHGRRIPPLLNLTMPFWVMPTGQSDAGLLPWTADAGRAQERGAAGGDDGAGAGGGEAPVAAALRPNAPWSDIGCWRRCAGWFCRRSSAAGRSRRGSSTTPGFPRRGGIRWA